MNDGFAIVQRFAIFAALILISYRLREIAMLLEAAQ